LLAERIHINLNAEPGASEAIHAFVLRIAKAIEESGFKAGGPLQIVALETATTNARLNEVCQAAYRQLQSAFADKLLNSGYSQSQADRLSTFIMAVIEGGIVLSRTHHSGDPLRQAADFLASVIRLEGPQSA
jgi:TetR/AcrR family transcriptional regulator, lmrAB and yxaGH operons repressor